MHNYKLYLLQMEGVQVPEEQSPTQYVEIHK